MTGLSLPAEVTVPDAGVAGTDAAALSFFEFWPGWLFYLPVVLQWIWLGLRFRDFSLPTAANPGIETGGLCGESKSAILDGIVGPARGLVAAYATLVTGDDDTAGAERARQELGWPLVVKPDVGCNGAGVRLVHDEAELAAALRAFSRGVGLVLQAFVPHPGEAGLFYIRQPDEAEGRITSVTLKSAPSVTGNGHATLRALVLAHPRAGQVPHLYLPRLRARWDEVPPQGTVVPLVFVGNHCRGSVFQDGAAAITPALVQAVDAFARGIPGFHFGRIDVRYRSVAELRAGTGFTVIEVNGAGSEATHIWDPACTLRAAYAAQFRHYRAAWDIGRAMRARGHRPAGIAGMWRAWRRQQALMASYPISD